MNYRQQITYTSEIVDGGEAGPLFRVIPDNNINDCFEASSMSSVWKRVFQRLNEMREVQGESTLDSSLSGVTMFGLADPYVVNLIEGLENADKCEGYIFQNNRRERQRVEVKIADVIPQGDGADDWSDEEHDGDDGDDKLVNTESNNMEIEEEEEEEKERGSEKEKEKESKTEESTRPSRRSSRNLKKEDKANSEKKRQILIPMMGPATGLRVRCQKTENGYIPVDSLMYV